MPSMVTDIMHNGRLDYGHRLLCRCVRHVKDTVCTPKRFSGINLGFEMTYDVTESCKGQCYRFKLILSCDG